jgi:hypothetical protein
MDKLDKTRYRLPHDELKRAENILKRAIEFEKTGCVNKPAVTEEHPDGSELYFL